MDKFKMYITSIIIVKVVFIILAIYERYLKHKKPVNNKKILEITYWRERIEFVFIFMMSTLLLYLFNPRMNNINMITGETKLLLFLFGFILIITAKWNIFISESKWFEYVQGSLGN
jgi:hypothetical protein